MAFFALIAALFAQARPGGAPPRERAPDAARPPAPDARAPLSSEDAALIQQLALLEKVELLQNLELFEDKDDAQKAPPAR